MFIHLSFHTLVSLLRQTPGLTLRYSVTTAPNTYPKSENLLFEYENLVEC